MAKTPTNKLSIYLIKEEYSSLEDIFKDHEELGHEKLGYEQLERDNINDVEGVYYGDSHLFQPSWIEKFFGSSFNNADNGGLKIFAASSKAVFLVKVENKIFVQNLLLDSSVGRASGC